ncbi:MAG: conjugal transfer protein TraH [Deferribacteraceae bacterium]|jgi:hypothetical protein|nr:conjugal transfer protein TraH [Deferribacteraceae bacterium]
MRIFIAFLMFLAVVTPSHASFVSDFVNDVSNNMSPEYLKSQERGYVTFGSYTKRTPVVSVNPISITPPSIQVGCNGIDIIGGGFSFLTEEGLKNIYKQLSNPNTAIYIAVSIAMKLLSPELANTVETAMAIINMLNSMQLDGCAIANGVVSLATDSSFRANMMTTAGDALEMVKSGFSNSYDSAVKQADDPVTIQKLIEQTLVGKYSAAEYIKNGGSLLKYIYKEWLSSSGSSSDPFTFPNKYDVNRVRALYGDVIYNPKKKPPVQFIPPCDKSLSELTMALYTKDETPNAQCKTISGENNALYAEEQMYKLYNAFTGENVSVDNNFINALQGTSIFALIKNDAGARDKTYLATTINFLKDIAAIELTYRYVDIYFQHLIPQLVAFREDTSVAGGDRGVELIKEVDKLISGAIKQQEKFKEWYDLAAKDSYNFLQTKQNLEQRKNRGFNDLGNLFKGKM